MNNLLLIAICSILLSNHAYSYDELNSHKQFEGQLPTIINYDPEFRPPMPMPQYESGALPDDEPYESPVIYDVKIIKREVKE